MGTRPASRDGRAMGPTRRRARPCPPAARARRAATQPQCRARDELPPPHGLPPSSLPPPKTRLSIRPCRCVCGVYRAVPPTSAKRPPAGSGWLHEIKHDGFRVIARKQDKGVRLNSRPADLTEALSVNRRDCGATAGTDLDGEAVTCGADGIDARSCCAGAHSRSFASRSRRTYWCARLRRH